VPQSVARSAASAPLPAIKIRDMGYTINGSILLHPLTIDLPPGLSIGLVGHNGSGKSTLLKLLGRQLEPTQGEIHFQNRRLPDWSARALAQKLAYLPQNTPVAPNMTVHELVSLGRYPWHGALGRFGSIDQTKVDEAIARTGLEDLRDRLVDTLSGGERQRAWIAMLIAQDADCLLLDEPISALDIGHQLDVLGLTRTLSRVEGITVVTVLHDINMAARFCDWIIALRGGQLIAEGTPEDIMTPEMLERIYEVRMDVLRQSESGRLIALAK
jgi:ferric hydroxamate transport system ATP-binding protein